MIERRVHKIEVGETINTAGWVRISTEFKDPIEKIDVSEVALHEAIHSFLLITNNSGVEYAEIRGGAGFNGSTIPKNRDTEAAVGPDSVGMSGTGHDLEVAINSGGDLYKDRMSAKNKIENNIKPIKKIAALLDRQGSATGNQMENAMKEGEEIEINIFYPDGSSQAMEDILEDDNRLISIELAEKPIIDNIGEEANALFEATELEKVA